MQVPLAEFGAAIEVRDADLVTLARSPVTENIADVGEAVRRALDSPLDFPPLRRALTPDDHVALVVDDRLPAAGSITSAVLGYLLESHIDPAAVTLISAAGSSQSWVADLQDEVQEARTEIHAPGDRKVLAYLASTRGGRRVYMNRRVVEADQTIVIAACEFDGADRVRDGSAALFPALSDEETLKDASAHGAGEAIEVAWLLGVPFFLHAVAGQAGGLSHVVGGTVDSLTESHRLLTNRWHVRLSRQPRVVISALAGNASSHDFAALAQAALTGSRIVEPNGRVVLLTHAQPKLGAAVDIMRDTDSPAVAARRIQERAPADANAALQWLEATRSATIYLLSELADETVEEMFATPLPQARQAQRLVDAGGPCAVVDDIHLARLTLEN